MKMALGLILCVLALCGCSTFAPMGKDTYMVCHRGSTYSTEGSLKILCLQDANKYCEQRGLAMVVVSTTGHDGSFWTSRGGECELVFLAVPPNDPRNTLPNMERAPDSVSKDTLIIKHE
jgi:hypothetical protein